MSQGKYFYLNIPWVPWGKSRFAWKFKYLAGSHSGEKVSILKVMAADVILLRCLYLQIMYFCKWRIKISFLIKHFLYISILHYLFRSLKIKMKLEVSSVKVHVDFPQLQIFGLHNVPKYYIKNANKIFCQKEN